jgi:site-specific DNA recombinase
MRATLNALNGGGALRKARHEPLVSLETYQRIQDRLNGNAKVPVRADLDESFPLRGFVLCTCGKPLTACWTKSKTGKKHPYYLCFNRACVHKGKSIRREEIEERFAALLANIQPSETMFAMAKDMASRAWEQLGEQAAATREQIRRQKAEIEKQTAALLDRIVEASSQSVIARYEQRITALERKRLIMTEKLATKPRSRNTFREMFELTLGVLVNLCNSWKNGTLGKRHAILKMAFEERLVCCRSEGFRTPKTSIVFKVLGVNHGTKTVMAEGGGFEPPIRFLVYTLSRRAP